MQSFFKWFISSCKILNFSQSWQFVSNFFDLINLDKSLLFRHEVFKNVYEPDKLNKKISNNDIIKIATNYRNVTNDSKNVSNKVWGTKITLADNDIKDVKKVIEALENRVILLKGTTRKITSQEGGFLIFLDY